MNKKITYILVGAVVLVGGYFAYKKFFAVTKDTAGDIIKKMLGTSPAINIQAGKTVDFAKQDQEWITERAKALQKDYAFFMYKGESYDPKTGKVAN